MYGQTATERNWNNEWINENNKRINKTNKKVHLFYSAWMINLVKQTFYWKSMINFKLFCYVCLWNDLVTIKFIIYLKGVAGNQVT